MSLVVLSMFAAQSLVSQSASAPNAAETPAPSAVVSDFDGAFGRRLESFVDAASSFETTSIDASSIDASPAEARTVAPSSVETSLEPASTASAHSWFAPAESAELESAFAAGPAPAPQFASSPNRGVGPTWEPKSWLSVGGYFVDGRYDTPQDFGFDEDTAFAVDLGMYNWRGEMGIGLEAGLIYGGYEIDGDLFGAGSQQVDVWRGLLGIRVADRGPNDSRFVPYVRGGVMYRRDDGGSVKDDGIGWYAGGGFDWRLGPQLAIGPSVLFNESSSRNAQEWLFGLVLTFGF
jgi:hypothetical protein